MCERAAPGLNASQRAPLHHWNGLNQPLQIIVLHIGLLIHCINVVQLKIIKKRHINAFNTALSSYVGDHDAGWLTVWSLLECTYRSLKFKIQGKYIHNIWFISFEMLFFHNICTIANVIVIWYNNAIIKYMLHFRHSRCIAMLYKCRLKKKAFYRNYSVSINEISVSISMLCDRHLSVRRQRGRN